MSIFSVRTKTIWSAATCRSFSFASTCRCTHGLFIKLQPAQIGVLDKSRTKSCDKSQHSKLRDPKSREACCDLSQLFVCIDLSMHPWVVYKTSAISDWGPRQVEDKKSCDKSQHSKTSRSKVSRSVSVPFVSLCLIFFRSSRFLRFLRDLRV